MARRLFVRAFDVWPLPDYARAVILPGQWITAGPDGPRGRYMGQTAGGIDVVAWAGNAKGRGRSYGAALRAYAKGRRPGPLFRSIRSIQTQGIQS